MNAKFVCLKNYYFRITSFCVRALYWVYILVSLNPIRYRSVDARFVLRLKIQTAESLVLKIQTAESGFDAPALYILGRKKSVCAERANHCSVIFHTFFMSFARVLG